MENKICINCLHFYNHIMCKTCNLVTHNKYDYQNLESQPSIANALIKEQMEEIYGLRETLGSVKTDIEMAQYSDMAWLEIAISEIEKALSHPAFVDEELETAVEILSENLKDETDYSHKLQSLIFNRYAELFPNYAFVDHETSIDLIAAEIKTLRTEKEVLKEALRLMAADLFGFYSDHHPDGQETRMVVDAFIIQAQSKIEAVK